MKYKSIFIWRLGVFLLSIAIMGSLPAIAVDESSTVVTISTTGPDRYRDGTIVADGEKYALVAVSRGAQFAGFAADGTLCDPATSKILFILPLAEKGRCPPTTVAIDSAVMPASGNLLLVLLDTRATARSGAAMRVDGWGCVAESSISVSFGSLGASSSAAVSERSAIPADIKNPRITAIRREGNEMVLTVEDSSSLLDYNVRTGGTPAVDEKRDAAKAPVTGNSAMAIELRVPVEEGRKACFFQVTRHGGEE